MKRQDIALHLIKEDLKYHLLVRHLTKVDVHVEYFPDFASAVQNLLFNNTPLKGEQAWTDRYVQELGKVQNLNWHNQLEIERKARIILNRVS